MKKIPQEALFGCAIACTASVANVSYTQMRKYFDNAKVREKTTGFYNRDIVAALSKKQIIAKAFSIRRWGRKYFKAGTIVFIGRSKAYPVGHYLLKTKSGWMNPWFNCPEKPAKAEFEKKLPGEPRWVIEIKNSKAV